MVAKPGRLQAVFNVGEIGPRFDQRVSTKHYAGGVKHADRVELLPQGGFSVAPATRLVGDVSITADRIIPFAALNGNIYDLVFNDSQVEVWGQSGKLYQFSHVYQPGEVRQILFAQDLDTLIIFHENHAPWRVLHGGPTTWVTGDAPLTDLPNYDYGGVYTNGTASEFEIDFIGFHEGNAPYWDNIVFTLKVGDEETTGIRGVSTGPPSGTVPVMAAIAANIEAAILALPNVQPGVVVTVTSSSNPYRVKVTFSGVENLGDIWTLSGRVVNKSDAAVLANKVVVGIAPGEPVISNTRGWPRCGAFYQQRLLLGGFKSLPNAWMASITTRYFDFDQRLNAANGSFLIALQIPGGERIENIVNNQFLLIMTSENNYWVAGSTNGLSKTAPPKHVPATDHGVAAHVQVVNNEGAAVYVHKSGDFIGEMRYTDIDGNYATQDLTLLAYHLLSDVKDIAIRRKENQQSCNQLAMVNASGTMRVGYLLREQELTGYSRYSVQGDVRACAVNNRNELSIVVERDRGGKRSRSLERLERYNILDGAITATYPDPYSLVTGLEAHEGEEVWALADGNVVGPFTVQAGQINLGEVEAQEVTVGRWLAPRVETLPISRMVGPDIWLQKKARIHSIEIFVEDTTSIAVSCNGGKLYDQDLRRYGRFADVPELDAGYTGLLTIRGFSGFVDEPTVVITQLRPGRLTVKSIIIEASI